MSCHPTPVRRATRRMLLGLLLLGSTGPAGADDSLAVRFTAEENFVYDSEVIGFNALGSVRLEYLPGTARDGDLAVAGSVDHATYVGPERSAPDAARFRISGIDGNRVTLLPEARPAAEALAPDDLVLLVNLQGTAAAVEAVGAYMVARVRAVDGDTVTLRSAVRRFLGSAAQGQRLVLQRVPEYRDVRIEFGSVLSTTPFDGHAGGVLAFRALNLLVDDGAALTVAAAGYAGGRTTPSGAADGAAERFGGVAGASLAPAPSQPAGAPAANFGGGGSGRCLCGEVAGSGGHATAGSAATGAPCAEPGDLVHGTPGAAYPLPLGLAELRLLAGSGGGGGCADATALAAGRTATPGAAGGGILYIVADTVRLDGDIAADGGPAVPPPAGPAATLGGAGAGGTLLLHAARLTVAAERQGAFRARGGAGVVIPNGARGGAGGLGRIFLGIGALNPEAGDPAPAPFDPTHPEALLGLADPAPSGLWLGTPYASRDLAPRVCLDGPALRPETDAAWRFAGFGDEAETGAAGEVRYCLIGPDNAFWFHDGRNWVERAADDGAGAEQVTNTAGEIDAHLASWPPNDGQTALRFCAYLLGDGATPVSLSQATFRVAVDDDGDSFVDLPGPGFDCADDDPLDHPGAAERCDARDNDCDGETDEGGPLCPEGTVCAEGSCRPTACSDGNPCTFDQEGPTGGCSRSSAPAGTACSDGDPCNGAERCDGAGRCESGAPPQCDDADPCTADSCDPASAPGADPCRHLALTAGSDCGTCRVCDAAGACIVTAGAACGGDRDCARCSPAGMCEPSPAGTSCADADPCNGLETCDGAGRCAAAAPPDCDDRNPCTLDLCAPDGAGPSACEHVVQRGLGCGPGLVCTPSGACRPADDVDCAELPELCRLGGGGCAAGGPTGGIGAWLGLCALGLVWGLVRRCRGLRRPS